MHYKITLLVFLALLGYSSTFAQKATSESKTRIEGVVVNGENETVPFAHVYVESLHRGCVADESGHFALKNIPPGTYSLVASTTGLKSEGDSVVVGRDPVENIRIKIDVVSHLSEFEVFGNRYEQPDKIEALTRLPLQPFEQIQSISVIGARLIEAQGDLTIAEATRNVPGVYTFATYGNKRESMSSRGFRGIPILKNGVRVNSDFRGVGILTDMQGVDNIQVLKGSASITQGVATDLGSPGGVMNLVTKTPVFTSGGAASIRLGSYGQVRPAFDVYGPIGESKTTAFRINGAFERADSYRAEVGSERFYINPSFAWKIDDQTELILEMDYLDDSRVPDPGTVNLAENDVNAIFDLPYDKFVGFRSDRTNTKNATWAARLNRTLTNKLTLRAAFYRSNLNIDDKGAGLSKVVSVNNNPVYNLRQRTYGVSTRKDDNSVFQIDLIGDGIKTGKISHVFQVGFDYRTSAYETSSRTAGVVDTIDVFSDISNTLPGISLGDAAYNNAKTRAIGMTAQDVISWTSWLKTFMGIRLSSTQTLAEVSNTTSEAFNPLAGIIVSPAKRINIFASYTNSAYPRTASRLGENGKELGNERFDQIEAGVKTSWINDRLRFNLTFFKINNRNINLPVYDESWTTILYYAKGGNDQRQGIEVELTGRVLRNLEVIAGYSFIDAKYKEHTSYVYNSAPLNTPRHTFNAYANYLFRGKLEGLSLGAGAYYTGARPVNDWSAGAVTHEGIVPGQEPFAVDAYTIVNFQAGYQINTHWGVRLFANNIFNEIGYNTYRTKYINQTDPINFAGSVQFTF